MPSRKPNMEDELPAPAEDFGRRLSEVDFDPWGIEEDDGSQRRRDPFRQPGGVLPEAEET